MTIRNIFKKLIILPMLFLCSCVVTRSEGDRIQQSVNKLKSEVANTQGSNFDLLQRLNRRVSRLEIWLTNTRKEDARANVDSEVIYGEVQAVRGKIEVANHEISLLKTELVELKAKIKEAQKKPAKPKSRKQLIERGQAELKKKQYKKAAASFELYADTFPRDRNYMAIAVFGNGKANIALAKQHKNKKKRSALYKKAIMSFQRLLTKFPRSINTDRALYNIGQAFEALGYKKDAIIFYEEILSKHKKSKLLKSSKKRLQALKPKVKLKAKVKTKNNKKK